MIVFFELFFQKNSRSFQKTQIAEGIGTRVVFQVPVQCGHFSLLSTSMDNVNVLMRLVIK